MRRLRVLFATLVVCLMALAWFATRGEAQPNSLKLIVPGVWFREGDIDKEGHCNNVIIEMKDHLIVVDANFPSGARRVMEDARRVSSKPVKMVFDTHHHGDHAYGNVVWTRMGAVTVAFPGVAEEMKRREPNNWRETAKERKDVAELGVDTAELPKRIFSKSDEVIADDFRRVEFHFFGWAHTKGDGFVYLPKEKVLCTGDAVVNGPYNYIGEGNITNWPNVIRRAETLDVVHVLPGHGPAGDKSMMARQAQFFTELRKAVADAVKAGKKIDDIAPAKGKPSITLSDAVKVYVGNDFGSQVRDAYREVSTGKPAGAR